MLVKPPDIYVKDTGTARGRGAFAGRSFQQGEVVEVCPVVLFQTPFPDLHEEIQRVVFNWEVLARAPKGSQALALGYGSMYNHEDPANMRYHANPLQSVMIFLAVRNIAVDEELTINYNAVGGGHAWKDDNWFERMRITRI